MSKNFGHTFDTTDAPRRSSGAQVAFWVTVAVGVIVAPAMGPGALAVFALAILIAWACRPWGEA